jgi:hypothetical protein
MIAEYHSAVPRAVASTRVRKFSSRWVPGSSLDARTSLLVFVAETTMKYRGNTDTTAAKVRKT